MDTFVIIVAALALVALGMFIGGYLTNWLNQQQNAQGLADVKRELSDVKQGQAALRQAVLKNITPDELFEAQAAALVPDIERAEGEIERYQREQDKLDQQIGWLDTAKGRESTRLDGLREQQERATQVAELIREATQQQ